MERTKAVRLNVVRVKVMRVKVETMVVEVVGDVENGRVNEGGEDKVVELEGEEDALLPFPSYCGKSATWHFKKNNFGVPGPKYLVSCCFGPVAGAGFNASIGAIPVASGKGTVTAAVVEMFIVAWVEKSTASFYRWAGGGVAFSPPKLLPSSFTRDVACTLEWRASSDYVSMARQESWGCSLPSRVENTKWA